MDTVSVRIPASPEYLQVIRLIAAGLASRLRFTIDDIEDLKIAVDELTAYLTGAQGREGTLEIDFTVGGNRIEITGSAHYPTGHPVRTDLTEFSRMILETVVDEAELRTSNSVPRFSLVKIKA